MTLSKVLLIAFTTYPRETILFWEPYYMDSLEAYLSTTLIATFLRGQKHPLSI